MSSLSGRITRSSRAGLPSALKALSKRSMAMMLTRYSFLKFSFSRDLPTMSSGTGNSTML